MLKIVNKKSKIISTLTRGFTPLPEIHERKPVSMVAGFTLLETLLYLAFFTLLIGSGTVAVYHIIESSQRTHYRIAVEEEGNFLLRKIDAALTDPALIDMPLLNGTSSTLSVQKINSISNPIRIDVSEGRARLTRGTGTPVMLTASDTAIENLVFEHIENPEGVRATFSIHGIVFETARYKRKPH